MNEEVEGHYQDSLVKLLITLVREIVYLSERCSGVLIT